MTWLRGALAFVLALGVAGASALLVGAPSAAAGGGSAAGKAGIASGHYLATDPTRLSALGASWSYDWTPQQPRLQPGLGWVPMVWGSSDVTPAVIASLREAHADGAARYLLGFNEPDSSAQANMTPAQAAALWPQLESTGLILGSPAPAVPEDGWLAKFMRLVHQRHLRVNFIAVHYYQDFTDPHAVATLRRELTEIHRQFHRPIWVTEIGALNIRAWGSPMQHAPSYEAALRYMRELFPMLNALPFVKRYAWFTDNCWNDPNCRYGSLYNGRGRLTRAGKLFAREAEMSSS